MIQDHAVGRDVLLLSPKGEGKNAIANQFASLLGYNLNLFHMYHEMTSRDLFLRRGTDPVTGDTRWEESVLVQAARLGELCVLDGVEKLRPDVLATLQGFVNDRDTYLPDNRRLVGERHVHHDVFVDQFSKDIVKGTPIVPSRLLWVLLRDRMLLPPHGFRMM
jgi:MoxR-like ATPase